MIEPFSSHPPETKARAAQLRTSGASVAAIADELGVSKTTIERWTRKPRTAGAAISRASGTPALPSSVSVTLASGTRLEGLTADQALEFVLALELK
jgi:transposase-like protein